MQIKGNAYPEFEAYLPVLRALPHVTGAAIRDGDLHLRTDVGAFELALEVRRHPLNRAGLNQMLALDFGRDERVVLIPYVPPDLERDLAAAGVNFVDRAGNCHLALGKKFRAYVEGRKPPRDERRGRGLGAAGYRAIFALLARPDLVNAPVRTIGEAAGIAKTGVAHLLANLTADGTIATTTTGRQILRAERLIERWIAGYADFLRPKLIVARYRTAETDPIRLEAQIEQALAGTTWAFGGGAAAYRLTKHYRGEATVVHVEKPPVDLPRALRALPDRNGPLTVALAPGPPAFEGPLPHVAHPLLVYTELLATGGERERETAAEIRDRYLQP